MIEVSSVRLSKLYDSLYRGHLYHKAYVFREDTSIIQLAMSLEDKSIIQLVFTEDTSIIQLRHNKLYDRGILSKDINCMIELSSLKT
jgi:hypothetical protein